MSRIRNASWKEDDDLKKDLQDVVAKHYHKDEIVVDMKKRYSHYAWSKSSLRDRLRYFGIKYTERYNIDDVYLKVAEELEGPGKDLGYRAMTAKLLQVHGLKIPRNTVHLVMADLDFDGLQARGGVGKTKRPRRDAPFTCEVRLSVLTPCPRGQNLFICLKR